MLDARHPRLDAVCVSHGGIPKTPILAVEVDGTGLIGDGHAHEKHRRPDRAVSLFDREVLEQLISEGYPLSPGAAGENLLLSGLGVQQLTPGDELEIGDVVLRLEKPRKPCYVLDAIDPRLKDVIVGRCGYMASVVRGGRLSPGMPVTVRKARSSREREFPAGR